jgi:cytochrome c5
VYFRFAGIIRYSPIFTQDFSENFMSDHSSSQANTASKSNPIKTAIFVALGALALIIGVFLLAKFAVGTHEVGATNEAANKPEMVAKRIAPVTSLLVVQQAGGVPAASPAPAPAAAATTATTATAATAATAPVVAALIPAANPAGAAPAAAGGGEGVYKGACVACHGAGIAGAPKLGDKAAWATRIAQGKPTLYEHAIKGYQGKAGVMPAKGGNSALADADVQAAVDYMVASAK